MNRVEIRLANELENAPFIRLDDRALQAGVTEIAEQLQLDLHLVGF